MSHRSRFTSLILFSALLTALSCSTSQAQTSTWDDAFGGNFNNIFTWNPAAVPTSSTTTVLNFNMLDVLNYTATNNIAALTLNQLNANNPGVSPVSGTVTIDGTNALTFDASGANNAFIRQNGQGILVINTPVVFGATNVNMSLIFDGTGTGSTTLSNTITGTATNTIVINTTQFGVTTLSGNNTTFLGNTTLQQGILSLGNINAIGASAGNTLTVNGPSTILDFALGSAGTVANNITLNGNNNLNLTGNANQATLSGLISNSGGGSGGVTLNSGIILLSNAANSFSGLVIINGGRLVVNVNVPATGNGPLGSGTGAIQIGRAFGSGGPQGASQLFLDARSATAGDLTPSGAISGAELNLTGAITTFDRPIVVNAGSGVYASITNTATAAVTFSNTITLNRGLVVDAGPGVTFGGAISGSGLLRVQNNNPQTASPDVTFGVANTYSGGTILDAVSAIVATNTSLGTGPVFAGRFGFDLSATAPVTIANKVYIGPAVTAGATALFAFGTSFSGSNNMTFTQGLSGFGSLVPNMSNATITLQGANNNVASFFNFNAAPTGTNTVDILGNTINGGFTNFNINAGIGYFGSLIGTAGSKYIRYGATQQFSGPVDIEQLIAQTGTIQLLSITTPTISSGVFSGTAVTVNAGGAFTMDNTNAFVDRLSNATKPPINLNAGVLNLLGRVGAATTQTTGPLNVSGFSTETITPTSGGAMLTHDALNRVANGGGTLRARGVGLGNPPGAGTSTIIFTTAPTLFGGGGGVGSTMVSILPYGVGGIAAADVGTSFLTYDLTNGLRPLTVVEYAPYAGATVIDNVGIGAAPTATLAGQNINSLRIDTTAATVGVVIPGNGTALTIGSSPATSAGLLTMGNAVAASAQPLTITGFSAIDFGNREGIIHQVNLAALGAYLQVPITGTGGLTKSGASTLILGAASPGLSGQISVGGGTLYFSNDNQLGPTTNAVLLAGGTLQDAAGSGVFPRQLLLGASGGTFNSVAGQDVTISGITALAGQQGGSLIKTGTGTLTLTGTNVIGSATNGGKVSIQAGVLSIPDETVLGAAPFVVFEGGIVGQTLRITGNNVTINKTMVFNGSNTGGYIDIPGAAQNVTWGGEITGGNSTGSGNATSLLPLEFVKVGAGNLNITNFNTSWATISVLQGKLTFKDNGMAPNTTGPPLVLTTTNGVAANSIASGTLVAFGSTLTLDNTGTNLGDRLADSQSLRLQNGNFEFIGNNSAVSQENMAALVLESGTFSTVTVRPGTNQYASVGFSVVTNVSGTSLVNNSAGVLFRGPNLGAVPTGAATAGVVFTGASPVYTQVGLVGGGGARGTTNISIMPGGVGDFDPNGFGTTFVTFEGPTGAATGVRPLDVSEYATTISSTANVMSLSSSNVRLTTVSVINEPASVNSLILAGGGAGTNGSGSLNVASGMVLTTGGASGGVFNGALVFGLGLNNTPTAGPASTAFFVANDNLLVNSPIYGVTANTFGLIKAGPGTLTLAGANAFGGTISVAGGTLTFGAGGTITPTATVNVLNGATLSLNGFNRTIGNLGGSTNIVLTGTLTGGGTVDITSATLTVGVNNGTATFAGVIQGASGNLVRTGTGAGGTLVFINNQTYSGATTITNGALTLTGTFGALSGTSLVDINGGTLNYNVSDQNSSGSFNTNRIPSTTQMNLAGLLTFNANTNVLSRITLGNSAAGVRYQGGATITIANTVLAPGQVVLGTTPGGLFDRVNSATLLVRGPNLAISPYAATNPGASPFITGVFPGASNVFFTTAPAAANFVGGGFVPATPNISIIPWMVGDVTAAGNGSTFVTYDATAGLRPLNTNAALGLVEYINQTAVAPGGSSTNNVRLTGALALGTPATPTIINSLITNGFGVTGTTTTLEITSGALLTTTTTLTTIGAGFTTNFGTGGAGEAIVHVISGGSLTLDGTINASSLTKGGTGTLTLAATAVSNFNGTAITNGIVNASADASLGLTAAPNFGRVTFAGPFASPTLTYSGVTGAMNRDMFFAVGSGTINVGTAATVLTLSGSPGSTNKALSGSAMFIKAGTGSLTINPVDNSGAGGFTGAVRVDAGTLTFSADNNLGSGGDFIFNGGNVTLAGNWNSTRTIYANATATITMAGNSINWTGNVTGTSTAALTFSSATPAVVTLFGNNTFNNAVTVGANVQMVANTPTALGLFSQTLTVSDQGQLDLSFVSIGPKPISISGAGIGAGGGALRAVGTSSLLGSVTVGAPNTVIVADAGSRLNLYGTVTATSNNIIKNGTGVLNLAAPGGNAITGTTTVNGGTLLVNNQAGLAAGAVVLNGATIGGNGSVNTLAMTAGLLSPGNSVGMLTVNGNGIGGPVVTFAGAPTFVFEVNNATGTPGASSGTGWDLVRAPNNTGSQIALPTTFNIQIIGLNASGAQGVVPNFNAGAPFTWEFARSSGGISGFGGTTFNIDPSLFTNNNSLAGGMFSIVQPSFGSLAVQFTPVPEPASVMLFCAVAAGGVGMVRRIRSRRQK